jgi:hypothetical protein
VELLSVRIIIAVSWVEVWAIRGVLKCWDDATRILCDLVALPFFNNPLEL